MNNKFFKFSLMSFLLLTPLVSHFNNLGTTENQNLSSSALGNSNLNFSKINSPKFVAASVGGINNNPIAYCTANNIWWVGSNGGGLWKTSVTSTNDLSSLSSVLLGAGTSSNTWVITQIILFSVNGKSDSGMLIGTVNHGVWYSVDFGNTFKQYTNFGTAGTIFNTHITSAISETITINKAYLNQNNIYLGVKGYGVYYIDISRISSVIPADGAICLDGTEATSSVNAIDVVLTGDRLFIATDTALYTSTKSDSDPTVTSPWTMISTNQIDSSAKINSLYLSIDGSSLYIGTDKGLYEGTYLTNAKVMISHIDEIGNYIYSVSSISLGLNNTLIVGLQNKGLWTDSVSANDTNYVNHKFTAISPNTNNTSPSFVYNQPGTNNFIMGNSDVNKLGSSPLYSAVATSSESGSLSNGAIVGITFGAFTGVIIIAGLGLFFSKRKGNKTPKSAAPAAPASV